jgi:hypothetical protein
VPGDWLGDGLGVLDALADGTAEDVAAAAVAVGVLTSGTEIRAADVPAAAGGTVIVRVTVGLTRSRTWRWWLSRYAVVPPPPAATMSAAAAAKIIARDRNHRSPS